MNPVHYRKSPQSSVSKVFATFFLAIMLAACGSNTTATSSGTQPRASNTGKQATSASTSPSLNLNAANIHAQIGSLLIQSSDGFQCPYGSLTEQDRELGHLILATDRTSYSQAEIAQMRSYLTYYIENGTALNEKILNGEIAPPSTLRWVLGGETASIPGTLSGPLQQGCAANFTLTNTGTTPLQIPKFGVQLKARPQPNTYQYRLIDACSITGNIPYCPPTGEGGGGGCSVYSATIQLGMGEQNNVFSAMPISAGCSVLTIPPAAQVSLNLTFSLSANVAQGLIYSVIPVFTVDTTQGEQALPVPQLASTLVFANVSQFSCYGLQGTTLVLLKSPAFGMGPDKNWCL